MKLYHVVTIAMVLSIGFFCTRVDAVYAIARGGTCTSPTDTSCDAGLACKAQGVSRAPTYSCQIPCGSGDTCAAGMVCTRNGAGAKYCIADPNAPGTKGRGANCDNTAQCQTGLQCVDTGPRTSDQCQMSCTSDSDCGGGLVCIDTPSLWGIPKYCTSPISGPGSAGKSCLDNSECNDGLICEKGNALGRRGTCQLPPPPDVTSTATPVQEYEATPYELPDVSVLNKLRARTPQQLIGNLLRAVTGIFGSIALVMVIYGGFTMMTAQAKSDQIKKGANIVLWACIGLVALMSSYAMIQFVLSTIPKVG